MGGGGGGNEIGTVKVVKKILHKPSLASDNFKVLRMCWLGGTGFLGPLGWQNIWPRRKPNTCTQYCGSGSKLDPYSATLWFWIRLPNTDPHKQKLGEKAGLTEINHPNYSIPFLFCQVFKKRFFFKAQI